MFGMGAQELLVLLILVLVVFTVFKLVARALFRFLVAVIVAAGEELGVGKYAPPVKRGQQPADDPPEFKWRKGG